MNRHHINVLIACEESQAECLAFRQRGFNAYSCDIQPCRPSGNPEYHIMGDVRPYLYGYTKFQTQDGKRHHLSRWHVIIAHPPCTYLCKVSSIHMVHDGQVDPDRESLMKQARQFFFECYYARADFVAVENPLPMARAQLPRPSCYVQPYWYGHKYSKKTLYWLRNLPPLMPEIFNPDYKCFVTASRGKYRSRTFQGVAIAMAHQWGNYIESTLSVNKKQL